MYKVNYWVIRKIDIALERSSKPGINRNIHWLNPLMFKRKSK